VAATDSRDYDPDRTPDRLGAGLAFASIALLGDRICFTMPDSLCRNRCIGPDRYGSASVETIQRRAFP
jgi:hypothetical protein